MKTVNLFMATVKHTAKASMVMLGLTCALPTIAATQPETSTIEAGMGAATIAFPAGWLKQNGEFSQQLDPLQCRVLLLDNHQQRVLLVSLDLTSLPENLVTLLQQEFSKTLKMPADHVVVMASHSFATPHIMPSFEKMSEDRNRQNQELTELYHQAVIQAGKMALQTLAPTTMVNGHGYSNVNVNRDIETHDGWWLGTNERGTSDKSVPVLTFLNQQHQPQAILFNYAVQSSVLNGSQNQDGQKTMSADLQGAAVRHIDSMYQKPVAFFTVGAAGDQAPAYTSVYTQLDAKGQLLTTDLKQAGYPLVELQGQRLGDEVFRISQQAQNQTSAHFNASKTNFAPLHVIHANITLSKQAMDHRLKKLHPTHHYTYQMEGTVEAPVVIVQIGDTALIGVQAELNASTGMDIKNRSPFAHTMVLTMVNGAAKYMADASSYDRFTYEAMNSQYGRNSAEQLTDKVLSMLNQLKSQQ